MAETDISRRHLLRVLTGREKFTQLPEPITTPIPPEQSGGFNLGQLFAAVQMIPYTAAMGAAVGVLDARMNHGGIRAIARDTVYGAIAPFILGSLTGCGNSAPVTRQNEVLPTATREPIFDIAPIVPFIEAGRKMRSEADKNMLFTTSPGTDLAYFGNQTVAQIRAIQDKNKRVWAAIGFLDVMNNPRYNNNLNTCNIYTLDLLRLLLGNEVIGSYYKITGPSKADLLPVGAPGVAGLNVWNDPKEALIQRNNYRAFSSNELDLWMINHGSKRYGWVAVNSQADLIRVLNDGYVTMGVTPFQYIMDHQTENPIGHAFVLSSTAYGGIQRTQSTSNIEIDGWVMNSTDYRVRPEQGTYKYWAHKLP